MPGRKHIKHLILIELNVYFEDKDLPPVLLFLIFRCFSCILYCIQLIVFILIVIFYRPMRIVHRPLKTRGFLKSSRKNKNEKSH